MIDSCPICHWRDVENCTFSPHECLRTHMSCVHNIRGLYFYRYRERSGSDDAEILLP